MKEKQYVDDVCRRAKSSKTEIANLSTKKKNEILKKIAAGLIAHSEYIISENRKDLDNAEKSGVTRAFMDRLLLNNDRLKGMADSINEIASLDDPIGRIENMRMRPSGIRVGQMRVPIGVVLVIYESRPNVTTDIAALCLKSGNVCILRGGKESIHSNMALHTVVAESLRSSGITENAVIMIEHTKRELVNILLKQKDYVDIVIPRGGESLIEMVTSESRIPVIKHDKGVCHTFIDKSAEEVMANAIAINAKVQRPGVCNAMETLLIHTDYTPKKSLLSALLEKGVEIRGCDKTRAMLPDMIKTADEKDWGTEYLDLVLSVKIVDSLEEAIRHIHSYGSGHSETIVTDDYLNAEKFLKEVDSSAVFVNASTRFHDGGEFGLGAEVGISTQKLHARGTMGIEGLTCLKYIIYGTGQVRS